MTILAQPVTRRDLSMAMIVVRREVRDSFRDWRMLVPIIILTSGFPALMNFVARRMLGFMQSFGADLVATQLIPFLLLVVGFFPISFSLIIALEAFVGEKERKSMEPLLATPLTNTQLYMGKMVASLVPPLFASYLGMLVYSIGLRVGINWQPDVQLLVQIVLLMTVHGVVMVAGAVIVSSQTTSVRAANLLASFIIVPMALLIQFEAFVIFWGNLTGLWWLILALAITAMVLIRMGVRIFNREELLGQEIDQLRLKWIWQQFWQRYSGKGENGRYPNPIIWYKQTVAIVPNLRLAIVTLLIATVGATLLSLFLADVYQLPADMHEGFRRENLVANLDSLETVFVPGFPIFVFMQNVRVLLVATILGMFTFGVLGILISVLPWGIIGYIAAQFSLAGENPWEFLLATIVPHGVIELPTLLLAMAAALRWHTVAISPPPDHTLSEGFVMAAADFGRILVGIVMPLLFVASLVEAYVTPAVVLWIYGS